MIHKISILGCGWLGLPLGIALSKEGYIVQGSTTSKEKLALIKEKGINAYLLQVKDNIEGDDVASFFEADLIIINIPPGGRRDPDVVQTYPHKIKAILEKIKQSSIKYVLFVSSTGVYGEAKGEVTELSATIPGSNSGQAVLAAENLLAKHSTIETTILRMAGLVGGNRKAGRFLAGKKNIPNGNAPVNLVHLEDCIAVIQEVIRQGAWNQIFNVCADEHPVKSIFYRQQAINQGFEPPSFLDKSGGDAKIISNAKLKRQLDYLFKHPDPMFF